MKAYQNLLQDILDRGVRKPQRAVLADGTRPAMISLFGRSRFEHDLADGFPLLTTKRMSFKIVAAELAWFLSGSTNVKDLQKYGVNIWNQWADEAGELGNVYGALWRKYPSANMSDEYEEGSIDAICRREIDQVANLIADIRAVLQDPEASSGRRLLLVNWLVDPALRPLKAPPGCHTLAQFSVTDGKLDCCVYMRSADVFLGVPYNIASYALLTTVLAAVCPGPEAGVPLYSGRLSFVFGDVHVYENHLPQVYEVLRRRPLDLPRLAGVDDLRAAGIAGFRPQSYDLTGYNHHPALTGEVAV